MIPPFVKKIEDLNSQKYKETISILNKMSTRKYKIFDLLTPEDIAGEMFLVIYNHYSRHKKVLNNSFYQIFIYVVKSTYGHSKKQPRGQRYFMLHHDDDVHEDSGEEKFTSHIDLHQDIEAASEIINLIDQTKKLSEKESTVYKNAILYDDVPQDERKYLVSAKKKIVNIINKRKVIECLSMTANKKTQLLKTIT